MKSTTLRAVRKLRSARRASSSISCQAASLIGRELAMEVVHVRPPRAGCRCRGCRRRRPASAAAALGRLLDRDDRAGGEQVGAQVLVEHRVLAAHPLEAHRGVLGLLVAVVREHRPQLGVARRVDALLVPVHGLELLHERDQPAVPVERLRAEVLPRLVQAHAGIRHRSPSASRRPGGLREPLGQPHPVAVHDQRRRQHLPVARDPRHHEIHPPVALGPAHRHRQVGLGGARARRHLPLRRVGLHGLAERLDHRRGAPATKRGRWRRRRGCPAATRARG